MAISSNVATLGINITANLANFEQGMQSIQSTTQTMGQKMTKVGKSLTTAISVPLAGAAAVGVKSAMDLESAFAKVGTMLGGTGKSMDDLKKETLDLSSTYATSQSEIAEATYQAISAGVEATETHGFLDVAMKASVGGFTDVTTATDGLTSVMNAYGLETSEADVIANQMLITQNKGKTTFGELASVMGGVAPIASTLNIETQELFSSMAVLTAQGISTSESVTGLKAVLSGIAKPTSEATEMAQRLGIQFDAQAVSSQGLMPFLTGIRDKITTLEPEYAGLTEEIGKNEVKLKTLAEQGKQNTAEFDILNKATEGLKQKSTDMVNSGGNQLEYFARLFGSTEAVNSIMMLTSEQGAALFDDTMVEMTTNTGALDDAYKKVSDTTEVTLKQAFVDVTNALIQVGDALAPFIATFAKGISKIATAFSEMSPFAQTAVMILGGLLIIIPPIIMAVGGLMGAFTAISAAAPAISLAFGSIGVGIFSISWPIVAIIAGIVALVAVGWYLWNNWDEVWGNIKVLWDGFLEWGSGIMTGIGDAVSNACTWVKDSWNNAGTYLSTKWDEMKTNAVDYMNHTTTKFTEHYNEFATTWNKHWDEISTKANTKLGEMKTTFFTNLDTINDKWGKTWDKINTKISGSLDKAKTSVGNGLTWISEKFGVDLSWIKGKVDSSFDAIKNKVSSVIGNMKDVVKNGIAKIKGFFDFEWKLPDLKLPHFSMSGEFSLSPPSIPKFGVEWYDKGGVFDSAQVIGVGEKRPEFVGALDDLKVLMREVLREEGNNSGSGGVALKIENFYNDRQQDIEQLCKELEFYRKKVAIGKGGR